MTTTPKSTNIGKGEKERKTLYASVGIPKSGGTTLKKELDYLKKHPLHKRKFNGEM